MGEETTFSLLIVDKGKQWKALRSGLTSILLDLPKHPQPFNSTPFFLSLSSCFLLNMQRVKPQFNKNLDL
jgi:hypothetical protein